MPATSFIDLLPVPAAIVFRNSDALSATARNPLFQHVFSDEARLGSLLDGQRHRFDRLLHGARAFERFDWQTGDPVDSRHYEVTLSRMGPDIADRCLVTLLDRTAELRTERSLRREMMTDSLTGLPNRAGFADLLDERALSEAGGRYAVLGLNLDRFSRVNACMGGIVGDELLISVARRLKGALRAGDVLARTGGDEFAILMRLDDGPADAMRVAGRIESALSTPFRLSDFDIRVACSIGIAMGDMGDGDGETLIRYAQFAVKRSKKTGSTEIYAPSAFDVVRTEFSIETALRRAIDHGGLTLAFQPICDLATGRIRSFEALARWSDEDGRPISPADFIPVAEESGLIVPLGRWAIDEAVRQIAEWDAALGRDAGVNVAVNLSAIQIHRDEVVPLVGQALSRHGVEGNRLTIELTESAIITDPDRAIDTLDGLKSLGASLAMDDFGTGYSNLAYLQRLPIDTLKIDRSFITDMLTDRDKVAIVRAILSLAQTLNMTTTAEGIENREVEQTLAALGCTMGQGFYYSRPLPPDDALSFLRSRNS
ncbi:putative bifunctional diguanylate cyclase/phosphodiesterase [Sphingomonas sp. FW199]|uniref:putative bifunctional diguanylate cyclase/phosphodiesterase n=1 Tax=Sphingomonas sp. FW199 TaxID=3400217 RepID=UPI003CEDFE56